MTKHKTIAPKERTRRLTLEMFGNYTIEVVVSTDIQKSVMKRGIGVHQHFEAMHCGADNLFSFIFLPEKARAGIVAHEVFHCVWHVFRSIGADLENEIVAYMLSYLVDEIMALIANTKRPPRPKRTAVPRTKYRTMCQPDITGKYFL